MNSIRTTNLYRSKILLLLHTIRTFFFLLLLQPYEPSSLLVILLFVLSSSTTTKVVQVKAVSSHTNECTLSLPPSLLLFFQQQQHNKLNTNNNYSCKINSNYSTKHCQTKGSSIYSNKDPFQLNNNEQQQSEVFSDPSLQKVVPKINNNKVIMKAWTCHGRSQRELVERLIQAKIIRTVAVEQVLTQVDRKNYVLYDPPTTTTTAPSTSSSSINKINPNNPVDSIEDDPGLINFYNKCYNDSPQSIGLGQTISAPHMHAHALEEIVPYLFRTTGSSTSTREAASTSTSTSIGSSENKKPTKKILDVGCGSGYLTACFGRWFQPKTPMNRTGTTTSEDRMPTSSSSSISPPSSSVLSILPFHGKVYGIDIQPDLVQLATTNILRDDYDLLNTGTVQLMVVNGWDGYPNEAPYDAIHVGAAASSFPYKLAQQLKVGGVLIVPIGPNTGTQSLYKVERISDDTTVSSVSSPTTSSTTPSTTPSTTAASSTSTTPPFDPKQYKVTELLGVRYVPLIEGPTSSSSS